MLHQIKITQFANVFQALSGSFAVYGYVEEEDQEKEADIFLSGITAKKHAKHALSESSAGQ
ncbi:hypothetical protein GCM10020331_018680 [Ectobacillus funiculus]